MPIAAVPTYLGNDFSAASPGLRFGMYLKLWGVNRRTQARLWETFDVGYEVRGQQRQEREVRYENKVAALNDARRLNAADKRIMGALLDRQTAAFDAASPKSALLRLDAIAQAPFTTGLGNEHPLENGFAFLNPYGLPYLPGSGVKGVLHQAARELASGEWGERHGWSEERIYTLQAGKESIALSVIDVLFGLESGDGDTEHVRGALSFWDVIPQIAGDSLMVEIMTPHQSHYYQQKPAAGSTSPHDSGSPNPISFLTVPPGSTFTFHVVCDATHLARLTHDRLEGAPDLLAEGDTRWQVLLKHAFSHAFTWLGFGAKTAVGYGAMRTRDEVVDHGQATSQGQVGMAGRRASGAGVVRAQDTTWPTARLVLNPGTGEIKASFEGKTTAGLKGPEADALRAALGDRANKLKKDRELKNVAVRVRIEGNMITLLGLDTAGQ